MGDRQKRSWLMAVLSVLAPFAPATEVQRCVAPDGSIEFRQHACPSGTHAAPLRLEDRRSGWIPPRPQRSQPISAPTRSRRAPADREQIAAARQQAACRSKRERLDEVNKKLRDGYTIKQGERLHRQQRKYEDYVRRHCRF